MKNPTGKKIGKRGSFFGGGMNHVRYDHKSRPAQIDIKCFKCDGLAIAQDTLANPDFELVGDMSPSWRQSPFLVTCTECGYRKNSLCYLDLTEPYYQIQGRGEVLWAWNKKHLDMIYKYLQGLSITDHPYKFYQTYIHGDWKKYRKSYIKRIAKYIDYSQ
ncbi:hypothetical protein [Spartinivicinus ruber]|uniref:hypothetical protein n=1 Tax=Spartinivicinus ruber TaxID=2683272 RepID=UPI0013D325BC|nr:hypothetical protein [Spartinivicinus ruber]